MNQDSIIVITGAAGFIGSYMTGYLNEKGFEKLILVDEFDADEKELNLHGKKYLIRVERDNFFEWLDLEKQAVDFVFHLGARTDTTEFDYSIHEKLNVVYSQKIWTYCTENKIPLIYASSAATYGAGEFGYKDDHDLVQKLQPLNAYGVSKNEFDKWALQQKTGPPCWAGLKFFNVYGPNEYHKERMASVVYHAFNQVQATGKVKLFRSHKPGFKDGEQLRDFIYVDDLAKVMSWLTESMVNSEWSMGNKKLTIDNKQTPNENSLLTIHHSPWTSAHNGIYNLGTGKARTFLDLVNAIFKSLGITPNIEFIDTPEDIRDKYQYFTEADMTKLRNAGYNSDFYSLEEGVNDYVKNYLVNNQYY